mmetsp:Transcript_22154/g.44760  ORF Transcript_22154/g.44760 Transcript_22154/m.44760 type:complete len:87 (-) Transcript_22154:60-320(-)
MTWGRQPIFDQASFQSASSLRLSVSSSPTVPSKKVQICGGDPGDAPFGQASTRQGPGAEAPPPERTALWLPAVPSLAAEAVWFAMQ